MKHFLEKLPHNRRKGSKPRCHWLTHGTREHVAGRLTMLASPWGSVSADDHWMPEGFCRTKEAQLDLEPNLLPKTNRDKLRDWWLAVTKGNANRPEWDIASTCKVNGRVGILLVEAKAHTWELNYELKGKDLKGNASANSLCNHKRIGAAIQEANVSLKEQTQRVWSLQRDRCYQMSNRFAWSWKLTELGYSVILVYLGFVNAEEMRTGRNHVPFADHSHWKSCVESHSRPLFPPEVWNKKSSVHDRLFVPRICSYEIRYDEPIEDA